MHNTFFLFSLNDDFKKLLTGAAGKLRDNNGLVDAANGRNTLIHTYTEADLPWKAMQSIHLHTFLGGLFFSTLVVITAAKGRGRAVVLAAGHGSVKGGGGG